MPETGSQILAYEGNANLGSGSNAQIPVIDSKFNLDTINNTGRDIMLLNHDNNIKLYDQKVKDRDNTLQMLSDGQISSGKIDPTDRPVYDAAKKRVQDDFYSMIKNGGLNNPDAVRTYRESVSNLKNITDWAQSRDIEFTKLQTEKADQSIPEDIKLYDDHINAEKKKDFWQPINPLQKAFDYNIKEQEHKYSGQPISSDTLGQVGEDGQPTGTTQWNTVTDKNGVVTKKQTTKTAPLRNAFIQKTSGTKGGAATSGLVVNKDGTINPISKTPERRWDFDTIQQNVYDQAITDHGDNYTQQKYLNDVGSLPDYKLLPYLKAANSRIEQYSTENGIQPDGTNQDGSPRYPQSIRYYQDPISKQVHIVENPQTFMAKHVLASIDGDYIEKPKSVVDTKIAELNLKTNESKAKIAALKALATERYAKANFTSKKGQLLDTQFNPTQVYDQLFSGKMFTGKANSGNIVTRVNLANMSKELKDNLGIDPINTDGDYNLVPANIKFGNKIIDEKTIQKGYPNWLLSDEAKRIEQKKGEKPSMFDFIYSQGGNFEVEVEGKIAPKYKIGKNNVMTVTNPDEAGKIIRSNRLQSYINQMQKGGVKGKDLLNLLSNDTENTDTEDTQ